MTARLIDLTSDRVELASADGVRLGMILGRCTLAHVLDLLEQGLVNAAKDAARQGLRSMEQR